MSGETALTPGEFNEEWVVSVDREHFSLSGKQMGVLRSATVAGNRGLIFFDKFDTLSFNTSKKLLTG